MKRVPILLALIWLTLYLGAETRALWVLPWDIQSAEAVDQVIADAVAANQNELLLEVRYRADALYTPNRSNSLFPNPEPRSYILADDGFDPLAYAISKAHEHGIAIQAWVIVFNATPLDAKLVQQNYIYQNHREWITFDEHGRQMRSSKQYGYFIDPGIPEVQDYLLNVFADLVSGYPQLDGLHLDYVRYPDATLGYHPTSVSRYQEQAQWASWNQWRMKQVTDFVARCRARITTINPDIMLTAAVFADIHAARKLYAQDWYAWLQDGLIDRAYPMAYDLNPDVFASQLQDMQRYCAPRDIVVGLRAWDQKGRSLLSWENGAYNLKDIAARIALARSYRFAGIALFSYAGLKIDNALQHLTDISYFAAPLLHSPALLSRTQINFPAAPDTLPARVFNHQFHSEDMESDAKSSTQQSTVQQQDELDISFGGDQDMYVIHLQIPEEGRWFWELQDAKQTPVYSRFRYYVAGLNEDFWDGLLEDQSRIKAGIYTLILQSTRKSYATKVKIGDFDHE
jgi:uncharacterized lipoprotein YddW (UPF0748 family)